MLFITTAGLKGNSSQMDNPHTKLLIGCISFFLIIYFDQRKTFAISPIQNSIFVRMKIKYKTDPNLKYPRYPRKLCSILRKGIVNFKPMEGQNISCRPSDQGAVGEKRRWRMCALKQACKMWGLSFLTRKTSSCGRKHICLVEFCFFHFLFCKWRFSSLSLKQKPDTWVTRT